MGYWDNKARDQTRTALSPVPQRVVARQVNTPTTVAPSVPAPAETTCPECGSVNYGGALGSNQMRCFDCNYGASYRNTTQGDATVKSEGVTKAAKQVPSAGYNPQVIVAKVN